MEEVQTAGQVAVDMIAVDPAAVDTIVALRGINFLFFNMLHSIILQHEYNSKIIGNGIYGCCLFFLRWCPGCSAYSIS